MATAPPGSMSLPNHDPQSNELVWEKESMSKTFNLYIYDYCFKRGFRKTARELLTEAEITPGRPPIDAKEGFLFEWWCVFWILFNTKSHGSSNTDALIYTQASTSAHALPSSPHPPQHQMQQANLRQGPRPLSHQIPQVNRMMNGNPGQMTFPMVAPGPQQNGIPIQSTGSNPAGPNSVPQQNFPHLMPGQRPGAPQQRGPNGVNPYQSPTIAHSPQNPGSNAGPNPQNPMNQLGPSPHMAHIARAGMFPPNANLASVPSTQTPPFSQLANSPSRPATPGQGMQPSPSLMDRKTPVHALADATMNTELGRLAPHVITALRQELGILDKELTMDEKSRILTLARQRAQNPAVRKPGPGGPQGPAGPSNLAPGMQLAGQRPGQPQPPQQVPGQQPQQGSQPQRVVKRNSTSPGEEHEQLPSSDNSPPDRKRVRRSSVSMDQVPPVGFPHQPQQQAAPQMMNGAMMRAGPVPMPGGAMNPFPQHGPPAMANPGMGIMGAPQAPGNTMSPGMGGRAPNMMGYHQGVHAMTKGLMTGMPGAGAGTPTPSDPPFNPIPGQPPFAGPQNNRLVQSKAMAMMPPPSPAGGPSKEQPKDGKPPGQNGTEGSPRNQQLPNPAPGTQGPPNPSGGAQVSTAPPTPSATSTSITAASPSAVVNGTPTINPATQPTTSLPEVPANFLTNEFMQSVASSLDDFETQMFRPEDGVNFEDFREWFNPDDLEMK